mgnify:FL=1
MKKILLLGGASQQIIAIKKAQELGYYTILCDYLSDNPGQYVADKFYLASTTEKDKILEIAKQEKIDGILAYASDPAAPTAAYVAEKLQLHGNPFDSVDTLCNKDKFRAFLSNNGFNSPRSFEVNTKTCLDNISLKEMSFPVIVKPVDSSGSKGVTVVYNEIEIKNAVQFAFQFSRIKRVIIEEFIEKQHPYLIGGDVFILDGKVKVWGLLNCHRDNEVNSLVPVGKSYPVEVSKDDLENVKEVIQKIVDDLNINSGAMNVELDIDKNGKVWPIDMGPRSGGNMIPDLLSDIFGIDIVKMSIEAAMGNAVIENINEPEGYYATYNLHCKKSGVYKRIQFAEEIDSFIYRKCLYKKEGDKVSYFDNASKCLGIVFLKFPNLNCMKETLERINELIKVEVE